MGMDGTQMEPNTKRARSTKIALLHARSVTRAAIHANALALNVPGKNVEYQPLTVGLTYLHHTTQFLDTQGFHLPSPTRVTNSHSARSELRVEHGRPRFRARTLRTLQIRERPT